MLEEIFKLIFTGLIGGICAFFILLRYFFSSYAKEKGRNLATKEDIAEITKKVEEVKHQYNLLLEQFKSHNQLRLAALDKRLEVHQEAFSLWKELSFSIMSGKETTPTTIKCENWWWKNCFYLDAESREAFWKAIRLAPENYHALPLKERIEIRDILNSTYDALQKAVELPPIKDFNLDDYNIQQEEKV